MVYFVSKNYQKTGHGEKRLGTTDILHLIIDNCILN